jgi:uncharacterized protein YecE (DUF72 family)
MHWHIGTMGFSYPDWQAVFYPPAARPADYLAAYAASFNAVELDTTFHAIPPADRVQKWADAVPDGFRFCPKTPKAVTHDAPIGFGLPTMKQFLRALHPMRRADKLGPILIQFPPTFTVAEFPHLEQFLNALPTDDRFAVEFRNASWETQQVFDLLHHYRCCWVAGDYGVDPFPIHPTADFLYLRFIGVHEQFDKHDRERIDMTDRLQWWHEQTTALAEEADSPEAAPGLAYAFMNNDYAGHAPATANRLRAIAGLPAAVLPPQAARPQQSLF